MKSLLRKYVPALLLVALMGSSAWAQGRVATVDLRKVFENYWKTKQATAALKERQAEMDKDKRDMLDERKKTVDEYQTLLTEANNQNLSLDERERRKKSAEDKLRQVKEQEDNITQYDRVSRSRMEELQKRRRDTLVDEIRTTVSGKAKSAGYTLVVDASAETANGTPMVLFSSPDIDITDAVLSQLNAGAPLEAPKAEEKKAEPKGGKK